MREYIKFIKKMVQHKFRNSYNYTSIAVIQVNKSLIFITNLIHRKSVYWPPISQKSIVGIKIYPRDNVYGCF